MIVTPIDPYEIIQGSELSKISIQELLMKYDVFEQQVYPDKENHIEYLFSRKLGISCCMKDGQLSSIHLYIQGDKVFTKYTGQLPYNICLFYTNQNIVSYLGEPDEKLGGSITNISIVYNRLGLELYFLAKVWDLDKAGIDQIVMFPIKKGEIICALCRVKSDNRCSQCKLVYYCSDKCQKTHWKEHKQFCKAL